MHSHIVCIKYEVTSLPHKEQQYMHKIMKQISLQCLALTHDPGIKINISTTSIKSISDLQNNSSYNTLQYTQSFTKVLKTFEEHQFLK